jgi:mono/diheme cytochrome c family protein
VKRFIQLGLLGVAVALGLCGALRTSPSVAAQAKDKSARTDAPKLFAKQCATCHGKDGHAKTFKAKFNHARDLTDAKWQADVSDERLFNSISAGRGKMPAFGKKLSKAEIDALGAHVRGLKK